MINDTENIKNGTAEQICFYPEYMQWKIRQNIYIMGINIMAERIADILKDNKLSVILYGSVVFDDFRFGWSDIDILFVADKNISETQANQLVELRQTLAEEYDNNPYFRLFEGVITSKEILFENKTGTVIYWGTSGQKIIDSCQLDIFAKIEILDDGIVVFGEDIRSLIKYPSRDEIIEAVKNQYDTTRKYGNATIQSIRSTGWILGIARCLYTLKHMKVISKTKAGEWALEQDLFPDRAVLERVLELRKNPMKYKDDKDTLEWIPSLSPYIQKFADVLQKQLEMFKR